MSQGWVSRRWRFPSLDRLRWSKKPFLQEVTAGLLHSPPSHTMLSSALEESEEGCSHIYSRTGCSLPAQPQKGCWNCAIDPYQKTGSRFPLPHSLPCPSMLSSFMRKRYSESPRQPEFLITMESWVSKIWKTPWSSSSPINNVWVSIPELWLWPSNAAFHLLLHSTG